MRLSSQLKSISQRTNQVQKMLKTRCLNDICYFCHRMNGVVLQEAHCRWTPRGGDVGVEEEPFLEEELL